MSGSDKKAPKVANNRWRNVKIVLGSLAVFAFAAWYGFGQGGVWENYVLSKQKRLQQEEIALLEARRQKVKEYLDRLQAGDELALETAARKYGLVGPNELIYDVKIESAPKTEK